MEIRCRQCNRLADGFSMCRACGYDLGARAEQVVDLRESDPERDIIDLIGAVLAAGEEDAPRPPRRFVSGTLHVDPLIDLEGSDMLPERERRRLLRR